MKRTVVIGASPNPQRYANQAVQLLQEQNIEVFALGIRKGQIGETQILTDLPAISRVHTVSIYLSEEKQAGMSNYLLSLKPKRLIFNPGAENPELMKKASAAGIDVIEACTLVMIRTGQY